MKNKFILMTAIAGTMLMAACSDMSAPGVDPRYAYRNGSDPIPSPKTVVTSDTKTVTTNGWVDGTYHETEHVTTTDHVYQGNKYISTPLEYKQAY